MKKSTRNNQANTDPYEDMVRLQKLDAYEALIKSNFLHKKKNKSIK